jgi:phosphatidylglycerophosphatase A
MTPTDSVAAPRRPDVRFLLSHPAHAIALGLGSGLSPVAHCSVGTLWAWASFLVMQLWLSQAAIGWIILASLPLGWWACTRTAERLRLLDPGCIVWDEIVAFWAVLWLLAPAGWFTQLAAFALFRFFDAVKPGPVGWADRQEGAAGIMADVGGLRRRKAAVNTPFR